MFQAPYLIFTLDNNYPHFTSEKKNRQRGFQLRLTVDK